MPFKSHEEYFALQSAEARMRLERIQKEVEARVPGAARTTISYNMPAFRKHIGVYPPIIQDAALIEETARFRGPKGNLSFPLDEDLPLALIGRVACALAAQYGPT